MKWNKGLMFGVVAAALVSGVVKANFEGAQQRWSVSRWSSFIMTSSSAAVVGSTNFAPTARSIAAGMAMTESAKVRESLIADPDTADCIDGVLNDFGTTACNSEFDEEGGQHLSFGARFDRNSTPTTVTPTGGMKTRGARNAHACLRGGLGNPASLNACFTDGSKATPCRALSGLTVAQRRAEFCEMCNVVQNTNAAGCNRQMGFAAVEEALFGVAEGSSLCTATENGCGCLPGVTDCSVWIESGSTDGGNNLVGSSGEHDVND